MIDKIKARCSLSEYASMCRRHDWSCAMSDDHSVYLRGTKNKQTLAGLSETSPNHQRIWELARGYHEKFTGGWTFEDGWRWVGPTVFKILQRNRRKAWLLRRGLWTGTTGMFLALLTGKRLTRP